MKNFHITNFRYIYFIANRLIVEPQQLESFYHHKLQQDKGRSSYKAHLVYHFYQLKLRMKKKLGILHNIE